MVGKVRPPPVSRLFSSTEASLTRAPDRVQNRALNHSRGVLRKAKKGKKKQDDYCEPIRGHESLQNAWHKLALAAS